MTFALARGATTTEVRVGVLAYMGTEHAHLKWSPVEQFLRSTLPAYRVRFVYLDLAGLQDATVAQAIDFVLTNPGNYASLELQVGASRIATVEQHGNSVDGLGVGSAVITRADRSELNGLEDLRGLVIAATTDEGFGGYQIVWRELSALGIDPVTDLKEQRFVGFPMSNVLDVVHNGQADVGIVRACVLEDLPDSQARYKVLSLQPDRGFGCMVSTRLYPDWPFATLRHTLPDVARNVAVALLQMPATAEGMRFTVPADYQSVHELFRELQIGPYGHLREQGLTALVRRYWLALALVCVLLWFWLLHTYRVEKLVHDRTRALRAALEERKQIEARMRASQEAVDHMSRLSILGQLSTTLAHELSQPLAGIANYGGSLLRRLDAGRLDDAAVRLAATEISRQAQHAASVLSRIRTFARLRVSAREARRPADIVADAVALFRGMLSAAPRIEVSNQLPIDALIRVDSLQIQQVLLNVLKNGLDAMNDVPPEDRRIDITLAASGSNISIHVRDYGSGLAEGQRERLFEPFYTNKTEGMGLGLSICYNIVEAHEGTLTATAPAHGPGTVFSISLPAAHAAKAAVIKAQPKHQSAPDDQT